MKLKLFTLPLVCALLAGAPLAPVSAQDALQNLIPDNAAGVVYVKSLGELQGEIQKLANMFQEGMGDEVDIQSLMMFLGLDDLLDMSKPAALAIGMPEDDMAPPSMVLILPFKDAEAAVESVNSTGQFDSDAVARGSFVAFAPEGSFKPGSKPCALLQGMPKTDVAIRMNLEAMIANYKDMIAAGMEEASEELMREMSREGPGAEAMGKMMIQFMRDAVASARMLDITLNVEGTGVDMGAAITVADGSPMATGLKMGSQSLHALAARLPSSHPMAMMMSLDMEGLLQFLMPTYEAMAEDMPEEFGAAFKEMMSVNLEMAKALGDDIAWSMGVGSKGIEMAQAFTAKDPEAFIGRWIDMLKMPLFADMGVSPKVGESKTSASGATMREIAMEFDWDVFGQTFGAPEGAGEEIESMLEMVFGSRQLKMVIGHVGKTVALTMGGDPSLAAGVSGGQSGGKGVLAQTLAKAGASPAFVWSMDLRGMMLAAGNLADRMGMSGEVPDFGKGPACPVGIYAGRTGLVFRGGMHADVGQILEMFGPFMR